MKFLMSLFLTLSLSPLYGQNYELIQGEIDFEALGGWASGGGNAIVCFTPEVDKETVATLREYGGGIPDELIPYIYSIELYDLFEAKLPRGLDQTNPTIIERGGNESISAWVDRLSERFINYVPSISTIIEKGKRDIPQTNIRFYRGSIKQINDIDGVYTGFDSKSCLISTMAIQRNVGSYFNLFIDERLFNHSQHSKTSRAALILHEYIYSQARKNGEETSATTRELLGVTASHHDSFTIDYLAFSAWSLGFTELIDIDLQSIPNNYLLFTNLLELMTKELSFGIKEFALDTFYHNQYRPAILNNFISYWNSNFNYPNIPPNSGLISVYSFVKNQSDLNEILKQMFAEVVNEFERDSIKFISVQVDKMRESVATLPAFWANLAEVDNVINQYQMEVSDLLYFEIRSNLKIEDLTLFRLLNTSEENLKSYAQGQYLLPLLDRRYFTEGVPISEH